MPESLRLFLALWPDEATRKALTQWQSALPGRKVPPENLHLTLVFLGEQPASSVPVVSRILQSVSSGAIRLNLDRPGYFPRSRINWAGMRKTPAGLTRLHNELSAALAGQSIAFDRRNRFTPHITLARHADRAGNAALQPILWHADRLVLVESRFRQDTRGSPPRYIPIAARMLGDREA